MSNHAGFFTRRMLLAGCLVLSCIVLVWCTAVLLLTRQHAVLAALMGGIAALLALTAWRHRHRPLLFLACLGGIAVCLVLIVLALIALLGV